MTDQTVTTEDLDTAETLSPDDFADALMNVLCDADDEGLLPGWFEGHRSDSFDEAGLMTSNSGVVFTMADGTEFQVTVVRSR